MKSLDNIFVNLNCQHQYCVNCLVSRIKTTATDPKTRFSALATCPAFKFCQKPINQDFLQQYLSSLDGMADILGGAGAE